jgi:energy-coupling factor transporter ATP-binding protein EcfA2
MKSNPFATRFIRPGASPFLFLDDDSAEAIVERLKANRWRGQIIGEHGSGKSTLVATLVPLMEAEERQVVLLKVGPEVRRLPAIEKSSLLPVTQLIIDGYEQLSWWSRIWIQWLVRRSGAGLLVTAHADVGLPMLYVTKSSEELAYAVVNSLVSTEGSSIAPSEIADAYRAAGGNVRETLFKLFDIYQERKAPK